MSGLMHIFIIFLAVFGFTESFASTCDVYDIESVGSEDNGFRPITAAEIGVKYLYRVATHIKYVGVDGILEPNHDLIGGKPPRNPDYGGAVFLARAEDLSSKGVMGHFRWHIRHGGPTRFYILGVHVESLSSIKHRSLEDIPKHGEFLAEVPAYAISKISEVEILPGEGLPIQIRVIQGASDLELDENFRVVP